MNGNQKSQTLKDALTTWHDPDTATYRLACALGIVPPDQGDYDGFREHKWLFCSANPLGETLGRFLLELANNGVIEYDENKMKFRWSETFSLPPST
jgi:hypothetical protein